jgi:hypothetical protein
MPPVIKTIKQNFLIHILKKNMLDELSRNVPQIRPTIMDIRNANGTSELKLEPTLKASIYNPKTKYRPIHNEDKLTDPKLLFNSF